VGWWEPLGLLVQTLAIYINTYMTVALSSADMLFKNSVLYKEFLEEREEILRHKWVMSEKEGKDVGFEKALLDWNFKHRVGWKKTR